MKCHIQSQITALGETRDYILRLSPFKEISRVVRADDGFALQANWLLLGVYKDKWTAPAPRFDLGAGLAYPQSSSEPYAIVHQYNRDANSWLGDFKSAVERRYVNITPTATVATTVPPMTVPETPIERPLRTWTRKR